MLRARLALMCRAPLAVVEVVCLAILLKFINIGIDQVGPPQRESGFIVKTSPSGRKKRG